MKKLILSGILCLVPVVGYGVSNSGATQRRLKGEILSVTRSVRDSLADTVEKVRSVPRLRQQYQRQLSYWSNRFFSFIGKTGSKGEKLSSVSVPHLRRLLREIDVIQVKVEDEFAMVPATARLYNAALERKAEMLKKLDKAEKMASRLVVLRAKFARSFGQSPAKVRPEVGLPRWKRVVAEINDPKKMLKAIDLVNEKYDRIKQDLRLYERYHRLIS